MHKYQNKTYSFSITENDLTEKKEINQKSHLSITFAPLQKSHALTIIQFLHCYIIYQ